MKEHAQRYYFFFFCLLLEIANPPSCNKTWGGRSLFLSPFCQPACLAGFLQSSAMWELAARLQSRALAPLRLVGNVLDEKPPEKAQAGGN